MELLSGQRRMMSTTGRTSFAILLAQDLAVVPLLFLISAWAGAPKGPRSPWASVVALGEAALAVGVIAIVGRLVLKPLFRLAAGTDNPEFFMAATLLISVGSGVVAAYAGLSMALGAFIAGLLLAETEYRRAVEAMIDPFRGLLLGVFFFSVGMHIDLAFIWREPLLVAGALSRHDRGQGGAGRAALPAVRRAVGRQRRNQPAAGAGRRIRLHRHRPGRPGRPDRGRRGGAACWRSCR